MPDFTPVSQVTYGAGDEQPESKYDSQKRVQRDSRAAVVALTADATAYDGACRLNGVYVNTATSTGATVLEDGAGNDRITLPTGLAAGTLLNFPGVRFYNSLFVDAGGGGNITLLYSPARFGDT